MHFSESASVFRGECARRLPQERGKKPPESRPPSIPATVRVRRTATALFARAPTSIFEQGSQYVSSAYLRSLEKMLPSPVSKAKVPPLEESFIAWFNSLPEFTRDRPFSMREFEIALGSQGRFISPVLLRLGWQRQRRWSSRGQYHRCWTPPKPTRCPLSGSDQSQSPTP